MTHTHSHAPSLSSRSSDGDLVTEGVIKTSPFLSLSEEPKEVSGTCTVRKSIFTFPFGLDSKLERVVEVPVYRGDGFPSKAETQIEKEVRRRTVTGQLRMEG